MMQSKNLWSYGVMSLYQNLLLIYVFTYIQALVIYSLPMGEQETLQPFIMGKHPNT